MPLATIPCRTGGTPVVSVACIEHVTAGQLGVSRATGWVAIHLPRLELVGVADSSSWLIPGMSITHTRRMVHLVARQPSRRPNTPVPVIPKRTREGSPRAEDHLA